MNPKLAVKGINGIIEGGVSITDFSIVTELDEIVKKQIERVKRYVADEGITALPVIVTLHQEGTQLVENVPIVPIMKLPLSLIHI